MMNTVAADIIMMKAVTVDIIMMKAVAADIIMMNTVVADIIMLLDIATPMSTASALSCISVVNPLTESSWTGLPKTGPTQSSVPRALSGSVTTT